MLTVETHGRDNWEYWKMPLQKELFGWPLHAWCEQNATKWVNSSIRADDITSECYHLYTLSCSSSLHSSQSESVEVSTPEVR